MKKFSYMLAELLKELQAAEGLNRKLVSALVIEKGSTLKLKGKKKYKKAQKQAIGPMQNQQARGQPGKPKGKCFVCKQPEHWKK